MRHTSISPASPCFLGFAATPTSLWHEPFPSPRALLHFDWAAFLLEGKFWIRCDARARPTRSTRLHWLPRKRPSATRGSFGSTRGRSSRAARFSKKASRGSARGFFRAPEILCSRILGPGRTSWFSPSNARAFWCVSGGISREKDLCESARGLAPTRAESWLQSRKACEAFAKARDF